MTRHKSRGFGYSIEGGANRAFTIISMSRLTNIPVLILHTKALEVSSHLCTHLQITGIEPLDLLNRCTSILGEVEDVDLAL